MQEKRKNVVIGFIVILVVVVSGLLGMAAGGFFDTTRVVANGIVVNRSNGELKNMLITSYTEYSSLLKDYKVDDVVLLTNNNFNEADYIVDFINYQKDIEIKNIDLEIFDDGITVNYVVNKKAKKGRKALMYFIPVQKGMMSEVKVKDRTFEVK